MEIYFFVLTRQTGLKDKICFSYFIMFRIKRWDHKRKRVFAVCFPKAHSFLSLLLKLMRLFENQLLKLLLKDVWNEPVYLSTGET